MSDTTIIRGAVLRLFFSSPAFSTGVIVVNDPAAKRSQEVRFAGKLYARVGDLLIIRGRYTTHPKHGYQFTITERLIETVVDPAGLASWLAVNGKFNGIGPVKAQRIAQRFASDWLGWLEREPEAIAREAGVHLETIQKMAKTWSDAGQFNVVAVRLASYELTENQVNLLWDKFKQSILAILEDNPYLLLHEVKGLGFKKVDAIAQKAGFSPTHPGRVEAAVEFALEEAKRDGSTCLPTEQVVAAAVECLGLISSGTDVEELVGKAVDEACAKSRVQRTGWRKGELLSLRSCHWHESQVYEFCKSARLPNPHGHVPLRVLELLHPDVQLDESQMVAVALAFTYRGCLISGGAGSGKTTAMKTIAELYQHLGHERDRILLCAPTGKAARRLEDVTGFPASTIHRLLGWSGGAGWTYHHNNPLAADVVICDEASMCDAELAYRLFNACSCSTAVVLVGDHHQLPPVGAGSLLRDAIENDLLPVALLEHVHRQAGHLKQNCHAILNGIVRPTTTAEERQGDENPWFVVQGLNDASDILAYIEKLFTKVLQPRLGYDPVGDVQFMAPVKDGPIGCKAINVLLQRLHQKSLGVDVPPRDEDDSARHLYVGDKVMQTVNDYQLQVMNGYQGRVLGTNPLTVDFGGPIPVVIPNSSTGNIRLAYCVTVHKYQGSQVPCAVVVCHRKNQFMLHRNWIYTAVTRAQKTCIILGDAHGVQHAVKTVKVDQRCTLLPAFAEAAEATERATAE